MHAAPAPAPANSLLQMQSSPAQWGSPLSFFFLGGLLVLVILLILILILWKFVKPADVLKLVTREKMRLGSKTDES